MWVERYTSTESGNFLTPWPRAGPRHTRSSYIHTYATKRMMLDGKSLLKLWGLFSFFSAKKNPSLASVTENWLFRSHSRELWTNMIFTIFDYRAIQRMTSGVDQYAHKRMLQAKNRCCRLKFNAFFGKFFWNIDGALCSFFVSNWLKHFSTLLC